MAYIPCAKMMLLTCQNQLFEALNSPAPTAFSFEVMTRVTSLETCEIFPQQSKL